VGETGGFNIEITIVLTLEFKWIHTSLFQSPSQSFLTMGKRLRGLGIMSEKIMVLNIHLYLPRLISNGG